MEIVRRAWSRIGESRYQLLSNNCEHFCHWCLFGESRSEQVDRLRKIPSRMAELIPQSLDLLLAGLHLLSRNLTYYVVSDSSAFSRGGHCMYAPDNGRGTPVSSIN